jgi:hypothetical protein
MQAEPTAGRRLVKTKTPGIYKRGGSYVVILRGPDGRHRKHAACTLAEARNLKAQLQADVCTREYRQQSRVTFADYANTWRTTPPRRQNTTRSKPLPQALPRPQPLPPARTRTAAGDLTNVEHRSLRRGLPLQGALRAGLRLRVDNRSSAVRR